MPANKNQHYVPQSYLRRFSSDENRRSLNLFLVDKHIHIQGASIKNQCSKAYFHGSDPERERPISLLENSFHNSVEKILQNKKLDEEAQFKIITYMIFQYMRTEGQKKRHAIMQDEILKISYERAPDLIPKEITIDNTEVIFKALIDSLNLLEGLKLKITYNKTSTDFITSDDPAIMSNRFYHQKLKRAYSGAGLDKAGLMISLPISPKFQAVLYDKNVYNIEGTGRLVETNKTIDVDSFNCMQVINCNNSIYFENLNSYEYISNIVKKCTDSRKNSWFNIETAIPQNSNKFYTEYKVVTTIEDRLKSRRILLYWERLLPVPPIWPQLLSFRHTPRYFDSQTGAGVIRNQRLLEAMPQRY